MYQEKGTVTNCFLSVVHKIDDKEWDKYVSVCAAFTKWGRAVWSNRWSLSAMPFDAVC